MKGALTLFRREMREYLQSPIATIVVIAFLLLSGGLFVSQFFLIKLLDMRAFFDLLPLILAVMLPAISMRIWAEDRQLNTLELLLSLPLKPAALVVGKFLAALTFFALTLVSTWTIPAMLSWLGRPDLGPILTGYLGSFLLGALFLSLGQFISGFCRDQIVAFILGLFACMGLFLVGTDFIASTVDGWWPGLGGFLQRHLGIVRYIVGFQKGVIDVSDLVYLVFLMGVFLALNGVWMEGRLRPRARVTFATACGLSLSIAMATHVILEQIPLGRFDLTANQNYTVSPATRELLRQLDLPATVKLYLSPPEKMPTAMRTLERDLKDALEELRLASGGKLNYSVSHMETSALLSAGENNLRGEGRADDARHFPELAAGAARNVGEGASLQDKLGRRGIQPFQVQSIEADELGVRLVYSAAAISYKDRPEEVIPQIMPEMLDQMEYLVLSKIYRMTLEEPPQVALVAPYEERSVDPAMMGILRQLGIDSQDQMLKDDYRFLPAILRQEGYTVHRIRLTEQEPIPSGVHTLILVEPGTLNDRQLYEVNRFLTEGGNLFLAAQRYQFQYEQMGRGISPSPQSQPVGVDPLLETWGVEIGRDILMDEESRVLSVSSGATLGPFAISVPVKSPIHVFVGQEQMNQQLNLTSQLSPIFYLWGSPLKIQGDRLGSNGLTVTTLFTSSVRSGAVPLADFGRFHSTNASGGGRLPLSVWVKGTFPDHFGGKPVPEWPKPPAEEMAPPSESPSLEPKSEKKEPPPLISQLTPKPGQLILVGCTKMFTEELATTGGQITFFMNAVDTLVSGGKLVGIRNKRQQDRVLVAPSAPVKAWFRFFTLGLMPMVLVTLSLAHAAFRRRLREAYLPS